MPQAAVEFDDLLGTPFVNGGRNIETGLDCWGLVMLVMDRMGQSVPDYKISCFDTTEIGRAVRRNLAIRWQKTDGPGAGVGVVMDLDPRLPDIKQHFGVCVNNRHFIHTLEKTGVILSRLDDPFWFVKIKGYYQWKK